MTQDIIDEITKNIENMEVPEFAEIEVLPVVEVDEQEQDVIKFTSMKEDLEYSIKMLRNNINNSERLLNILTETMMEEDGMTKENAEKYAHLDAGMNKNIELLQKARKDISIVISNLNKAKAKTEVKSITNNVTIETKEILSTADIVAQIRQA